MLRPTRFIFAVRSVGRGVTNLTPKTGDRHAIAHHLLRYRVLVILEVPGSVRLRSPQPSGLVSDTLLQA